MAFLRGSDQIKLTKVVLIHLLCRCQEALAPYKHIEEDLKSLKEVLEMKNQQIHQQALKISELEKIVGFKFLLLFSSFIDEVVQNMKPEGKHNSITQLTEGFCVLHHLKNLMLRSFSPVFLSRLKRTCTWRRDCKCCSSRTRTSRKE